MTFLHSVSSPLADFGRFVSVVGLLAFLWFVVGFSILMRAAEGPLAWRSPIAAASGVTLVARPRRSLGRSEPSCR